MATVDEIQREMFDMWIYLSRAYTFSIFLRMYRIYENSISNFLVYPKKKKKEKEKEKETIKCEIFDFLNSGIKWRPRNCV